MERKVLIPLCDKLKGYLSQAPALNNEDPFQSIYDASIWEHYNQTVQLICDITDKNYERFKIEPIMDDILPCVRVLIYRQKLTGLISRINAEFFSDRPQSSANNVTSIHIKKKGKTAQSFWGMLHPKVVKIAKSRFESGHFADSVEASFKEINNIVKQIVKKSIGQEFDGADLMNRTFSLQNPIITLSDLSSEMGKNIQKGYMQIFSGAMTGIRNPKAHDNIEIDDKRAIHFLFLASLLMQKVDERI